MQLGASARGTLSILYGCEKAVVAGEHILQASKSHPNAPNGRMEQGPLTSRGGYPAGGGHEMRVRHLPEVPHDRAALSVHHDDAVQIAHAAAGQCCNAALGPGHGLWRHCTVPPPQHDHASEQSWNLAQISSASSKGKARKRQSFADMGVRETLCKPSVARAYLHSTALTTSRPPERRLPGCPRSPARRPPAACRSCCPAGRTARRAWGRLL